MSDTLYMFYTYFRTKNDITKIHGIYTLRHTVEPRYFEVPREMEKKFEIAEFGNNRGSVKGRGKSKGIRSSFEIVGTSH